MKRSFTLMELLAAIVIIGIAVTIIFSLTGCNKQVFDFEYTFDKIVCNYDGDKFELKVDKCVIFMLLKRFQDTENSFYEGIITFHIKLNKNIKSIDSCHLKT